jgi:DNA-binding GntR family transcriptional regulator
MSQTVQLYDRLRAAILALDLAPGERLTERGLESEFEASRTPVRAALMRLDSEGLVQREGRGWIVSPIDTVEIGALAELREAVESAAIRLSVERASDADVQAIAALLDATRPARDEEQGVRAGGDFHVELSRLSGNALLADAVRNAMTRLARTRWLEVRTAEAREQAWRGHREIVEAVAARDAERASALIASHIRGTNERLIAFLDAERQRLRGHGVAIVQAHTGGSQPSGRPRRMPQ